MSSNAQAQILVCLLVFTPIASYSQQKSADSCQQFIKGRFVIDGRDHIRIKRTPRHQYERDTKALIKSKYKIKWVGDCTYTLTLVRTTDKDRITRDKIGAAQRHIITQRNGKRYRYTTSFSFVSADQCGTLTRYERKEETLIKIKN
ncbi:MAG TPA: hypothetical protein VEB86_07900 [Chryseosolibacter sp.]|nr:hypothetical protein [Chryseosolibacter sp.]